MSIEIEVVSDPIKSKQRIIWAWNSFESKTVPDGFKLTRVIDWWDKYKDVNNNKLGFNKVPIILLIFKDKQLDGIFPLVKVTRHKKKFIKINSIEFFSQAFGGPKLDIILKNLTREDIFSLFNFIKKKYSFEYINLAYLHENSSLLKCFPNDVYYHSEIPIINIEEPYEEVKKKSYSKSLKNNLNNFKNRLKTIKTENVVGKIIVGKEQVEKYRRKIYEVSNTKLKSPGMHSIYLTVLGDSYFDTIISTGIPFCSYYESDSCLLAYILGSIQDETVYFWDGSYNRNYPNSKNIGFGILALDNAVQYFSAKYKYFSLGHGTGAYKMQFSRETSKTMQLLLPGNTIISSLIYSKRRKRLKLMLS